MFSAFSFGKVIKTILPGSVFAAGLVLLVEAVRLLLWGRAGALFIVIANKEWVTAAAAALVPVSLILGFLLNTFAWLVLNQRMRSEVNAELQGTPFPGIRDKLSQELWRKMAQFRPALKADEPAEKIPARESLEYFYLPVVSLAHLNYL